MTSPLDPSSPFAHELDVALDAARKASGAIMDIYNAKATDVYVKSDGSPVTDADIAADGIIRETLTTAFPDDALMTEEGENDAARRANSRVWIVDPIDGTAQFVARTGKFDVLIALVIDGAPTVAIAMQPTTGLTHAAVREMGAWRNDGSGWEPFRLAAGEMPPRIVGSKYYLEDEMEQALEAISSKLEAAPASVMDVGFQPRALDDTERWYDVFIGFPQDPAIFAAREWDIAASELITEEAGGVFSDCWGRRHQYNKRATHISGGVVVAVSPDLHASVIKAIAPHLPEQAPSPDPADDL